jgi:hypothetical protein
MNLAKNVSSVIQIVVSCFPFKSGRDYGSSFFLNIGKRVVYFFRSLGNLSERQGYIAAFLSCIKRWIENASNGTVFLGNIQPFTLTGNFDDGIFPILDKDKKGWWTANDFKGFIHSAPEYIFYQSPPIIGSWPTQTEASHYVRKFIDKGAESGENKKTESQEQAKQRVEQETTADMSLLKGIFYKDFTTEIKNGTTGWDITQDSLILEQYIRNHRKKRMKKASEKPTIWARVTKQSVKLISDMAEGSNKLQDKIGNELKTEEEIKNENELDNPNNPLWTTKRRSRYTASFIQRKIQNIIELEKLCSEYKHDQ